MHVGVLGYRASELSIRQAMTLEGIGIVSCVVAEGKAALILCIYGSRIIRGISHHPHTHAYLLSVTRI